MIDSSEITVVVQGPVVEDGKEKPYRFSTRAVLKSIRKVMPKSEIILSTWKNSNLSGLEFDVLVQPDDPGCVPESKTGNQNRQIVSTQAGLQKASRKYIVKTRTDILFLSNGFLHYFEKFNKRNEKLKFFNQRVVCSTVFAHNPNRFTRKPFYPSDWFFFGLSEDIKNLWSIPLAPEPITSLYYKTHPRPKESTDNSIFRYCPEQYIWLSFLRKYIQVPCEHQWDYGPHNQELHELSIANNLILLSPREIGIKFTKYRFGIGNWISFYHHAEWLELYKKYCDPEYILPLNWQSPIKNMLSDCMKNIPTIRKSIDWYDYRYVRLTQAWSSPKPLYALKVLIKESLLRKLSRFYGSMKKRWNNLWLLFKNVFKSA